MHFVFAWFEKGHDFKNKVELSLEQTEELLCALLEEAKGTYVYKEEKKRNGIIVYVVTINPDVSLQGYMRMKYHHMTGVRQEMSR